MLKKDTRRTQRLRGEISGFFFTTETQCGRAATESEYLAQRRKGRRDETTNPKFEIPARSQAGGRNSKQIQMLKNQKAPNPKHEIRNKFK